MSDFRGHRNFAVPSQNLSFPYYCIHFSFKISAWNHQLYGMVATVRCYPRGLGYKLLELCEKIKNKPRLDLRQKAALNPEWTDLQIFRSLPFDDPCVDAGIPSLFLYLWKNENLVIPDGWRAPMEELKAQMEQYVPRKQF